MKDIAAEAGVTVMTVSNVLNGHMDRVSPQTADRILDIAMRMRYVPNEAARALSTKTSTVVGMLVAAAPNGHIDLSPHNAKFITTAEFGLRQRGYTTLLRGVDDVDGVSNAVRSWNLDGAILLGFAESAMDTLSSCVRVPVVTVDSYARREDLPNVRVDDEGGGYLATRHLLEKGHRDIVFVGPSLAHDGVVNRRYYGYQRAFQEASLELTRTPVVVTDASFGHGIDVGSRLASLRPVPTAVFATADTLAAGVIRGLQRAGKIVPHDVSVVGFDNDAVARLIDPPLTTVSQDIPAKADLAVRMVIQAIKGDGVPREPVLDVALVQRGSVASA
jgi:LacI family transcriptional regulator